MKSGQRRRNRLTENDCVQAARHVVYEFRQFAHARVHYSELRGTLNPHMALECRVLHHRILLEFFHFDLASRKQRNVLAADYADGWKTTRPPWFKDYIQRCHRMLAHISLDRCDLDADWGSWWGADPNQDVEGHLLCQIRVFLRDLPAPFRAASRTHLRNYPDASQLAKLFCFALTGPVLVS